MCCERSVNLLTNERQFAGFVIRQQLNSPCKQDWSGEGCLWVCEVRMLFKAIENALIALSDSPQHYFFNQILVNYIRQPSRPRTGT